MDQVGEPQSLLEWLTEKYTDFGANLEVSWRFMLGIHSSDFWIRSLSRTSLKKVRNSSRALVELAVFCDTRSTLRTLRPTMRAKMSS